ncbi:MAG: hypothetical protein AAB692_01135 [Patescibacteria group bacterium]
MSADQELASWQRAAGKWDDFDPEAFEDELEVGGRVDKPDPQRFTLGDIFLAASREPSSSKTTPLFIPKG